MAKFSWVVPCYGLLLMCLSIFLSRINRGNKDFEDSLKVMGFTSGMFLSGIGLMAIVIFLKIW
jgi:hypothetical protein